MDVNFADAGSVTTGELREILSAVPSRIAEQATEIVLRIHNALYCVVPDGVVFIGRDGGCSRLSDENAYRVTPQDVRETLLRACGYALYAHKKELSEGFVTFGKGYRMAVCGAEGAALDVCSVAALRIRIAREKSCDTDFLFRDGRLCAVLVVGSPGAGKTTLLRSAARALSCGDTGRYYRVAIVDERRELSGGGLQTGVCADSLRGIPKAEGISRAVRLCSPEVIVCDEIAAEQTDSIRRALNCGVVFIASMHGAGLAELARREGFRSLLAAGVFDRVVLLRGAQAPGTIKHIYETESLLCAKAFDCGNQPASVGACVL